jgi:hypothetical protein
MDKADNENLFLAIFFIVGYIKTPLARPNLYPFSIKAFYRPIEPKH